MYYPGYATAWLSPLIPYFAPPEHATWLRAWKVRVGVSKRWVGRSGDGVGKERWLKWKEVSKGGAGEERR